MGVPLIRSVVLTMVFIVLITVVVADSDSLTPNLQTPFSKWRVHISNRMASGDALFVHCKSKDDDLGPQNINSNQEFSWNFRENYLSSTMFWCYFRSSHGHAEFEVFWKENIWHTWLGDHCNWSDCIWIAKDDGLYLRNIPYNYDDHLHDWIPKVV